MDVSDKDTRLETSRIIAADSLAFAFKAANDLYNMKANRAVNINNDLKNLATTPEERANLNLEKMPSPLTEEEIFELARKYADYMMEVYEEAGNISNKLILGHLK